MQVVPAALGSVYQCASRNLTIREMGRKRHIEVHGFLPAPFRSYFDAQPEPEPEDEPMDEEEREARERKAQAQKEKEAGNAAYKARQFEEAVVHYDKAIELDETDISFLTNRSVHHAFGAVVDGLW